MHLNPELIYAAYDGKTDTVLRILSEDPDDSRNFEQSLYHAASGGQLETARSILDIREYDWDWLISLNCAAKGGNIEIIHLFIDRMNIPRKFAQLWLAGHYFDKNLNSLNLAAYGGQSGMVRFLVSQGADVNQPNHDGQAALFYAANQRKPGDYYPEGGDILVIETLLSLGADIGHKDNLGDTVLHVSIPETFEILLKNGADPNIFNKQNISPLRIAMRTGRLTMYKKLLEYGASLKETDSQGITSLEWAQEHCTPEIIEKIKEL